MLVLILSVVVITSFVTIGSLATWRYFSKQSKLTDEAVENYEALQVEFEEQLQKIRKSYSDFKVILGVDEEELNDNAGKGGPKMPYLPDIPIDKLPLDLENIDNTVTKPFSLLMEAASLKCDLDDLARCVSERNIETGTTPSIWPVKFEPKEQLWISSGFGRRRDPFTKRWTTHTGVDIPAPRRTPIVATADGTIAKMGKDAYLGNHIEIYHSEKFSTLYGHMYRFAKGVEKGTKVKKGDLIGYVGRTGRSTGTHVHYEVRLNGKRVNPKIYIPDHNPT
jgi:murein DD-endopeptidase MepM/ murein hydrolase activator NlpD